MDIQFNFTAEQLVSHLQQTGKAAFGYATPEGWKATTTPNKKGKPQVLAHQGKGN